LWASLSSVLFAVAVIIPAISLVVGGIVIMNIMLVSVTERTREIGIRKALGAKRADVLRQFLVEAAVLSLIGGLMGVFGGIAVALTVTKLIGLPSAIKLWAVFTGMGVATAVGVFFGAYPAWRASALDPIAALRFEM
jgi:putative ABC transport system permease protein